MKWFIIRISLLLHILQYPHKTPKQQIMIFYLIMLGRYSRIDNVVAKTKRISSDFNWWTLAMVSALNMNTCRPKSVFWMRMKGNCFDTKSSVVNSKWRILIQLVQIKLSIHILDQRSELPSIFLYLYIKLHSEFI